MDAIFAEHTVGVTELRGSPNRVFEQAAETGEVVAVLNHNRPAGYIVSPAMMAALLDAVADRIAEDRARVRLSTLDQARGVTLDEL